MTSKPKSNKNILMIWIGVWIVALIGFSYSCLWAASEGEKPQRGGILEFAVGVGIPFYDGHQGNSFGVLHPMAPFYSLLLKFDEDNYPNIVGDVAESWTVSGDHKTYTFKIRKGVKFHDGSLLTAKDVKATYDKIIFHEGGSLYKGLYQQVKKIEALDEHTVVFYLERPSASFLPCLASPWNFIYKADILAKDMRWYEKNVMGTGPFKFVEHVAGSHITGKRNEDYFIKDRPYLDGFRAIFIIDTSARLAAIRSGRVQAEWRGFPPTQIEDLVRALGKNIVIKESPLVYGQTVVFNVNQKPFDDVRFRRALSLAIDRWEGSKVLSRVTILRDVGGLLRPGSQFAMTDEEITKIAGYSRDIEASRKEARRLLREVGIPEGFSFTLINRGPAMPWENAAIWLIDQWRQIGLNVKHEFLEVGEHNKRVFSGNFGVTVYSVSDFMDEPTVNYIRFISRSKSPYNMGHYEDSVLDDLYERQDAAMDPKQRRELCKNFEKRVLDEKVYALGLLWVIRYAPMSSKVRGVKLLPSHYLNQDLGNFWLSKD